MQTGLVPEVRERRLQPESGIPVRNRSLERIPNETPGYEFPGERMVTPVVPHANRAARSRRTKGSRR